MKPILGVLGGMGPQASVRFYDLLVKISEEKYNARKNADYPHVLLSNLPVPDLISDTKNEIKTVRMVHDEAVRLQNAGANFLVTNCNTMHLYQEQITMGLDIPFISIIDCAINRVKQKNNIVGLLGAKTTLTSGLYTKPLEKNGIEVLLPEESQYDKIVEIIQAVISGKIDSYHMLLLDTLIDGLKKRGASAVILGCTELPLAMHPKHIFKNVEIIDTSYLLAEEACARIYFYENFL